MKAPNLLGSAGAVKEVHVFRSRMPPALVSRRHVPASAKVADGPASANRPANLRV